MNNQEKKIIMFRLTICLALVGMAAAAAFMPLSVSHGNLYSGTKFISSGNYGLGGLSLLARPSMMTTNYLTYAAQPNLLAAQAIETGPIVAAVNSNHKLSMYDVPSTFSAMAPLNIEVPSSSPTVNFLMKSRSSNINVESLHEGQAGTLKETASEDQPHINRHTVHRPIVQEVREIISPYRRIEQKINPVQEQMETIVPRGQQQIAYAAQPLSIAQPIVQTAVPLIQARAPAVSVIGLKSYGLTDFAGAAYKP